MNRLLKVFLFCLIILGYVACNNSGLRERVPITDGVTVLMPKEYKKNDMGDGNVMIRSRMGSADLRVVAIKDTSLNGLSADKLKEGLEINVTEFLKPMQGKLLQRKDTITGKVVMSDFEFELGSGNSIKHGKGKFILKGNKFITFLVVSPISDTNSNASLQNSFFSSIEVD